MLGRLKIHINDLNLMSHKWSKVNNSVGFQEFLNLVVSTVICRIKSQNLFSLKRNFKKDQKAVLYF